MNWLAILLSIASLGGSPATKEKTKTKARCTATIAVVAKPCTKPKKPKPKVKPRATPTPQPGGTARPAPRTDDQRDPESTPTPTPTPNPGASPTPTATPNPYPTRTGVDLTDTPDWTVRPSYRNLAAGRIEFNVNNVGEDDHNLSIRGGGKEWGRIDLAPKEEGVLFADLPVGPYKLYCSLPGHEEAGMWANISVR